MLVSLLSGKKNNCLETYQLVNSMFSVYDFILLFSREKNRKGNRRVSSYLLRN